MKRYYQYLKYIIRHKWFVFLEGRKLGVPIYLLILHDISKLRPSEFGAYARTFYAPDGEASHEAEDPKFNFAWLHHQKRNRHHWQYWVLLSDSGQRYSLPMPDRYRREMLADWKGMDRIKGTSDVQTWYLKNIDNIRMHEETRTWIEDQLGVKRITPYIALVTIDD